MVSVPVVLCVCKLKLPILLFAKDNILGLFELHICTVALTYLCDSIDYTYVCRPPMHAMHAFSIHL